MQYVYAERITLVVILSTVTGYQLRTLRITVRYLCE